MRVSLHQSCLLEIGDELFHKISISQYRGRMIGYKKAILQDLAAQRRDTLLA